MRYFEKLTLFLGSLRWLFLPFGIAALVAMGVHLASDVTVQLAGSPLPDVIEQGTLNVRLRA